MLNYEHPTRKRIFVLSTIVMLVGIVIAAAVMIRSSYHASLSPVSSVPKSSIVTIEQGRTTGEIADLLKAKNIIKSDWAFEWYVRNHELRDELKAGTYLLYQSQTTPEIVDVIVKGKIATDLVTILPGKRISELKQSFVKQGFGTEEVESAFNPEVYAGHPALTDKPKEASLEGYLYPESFQKTANTRLQDILRLSLDEMEIRLNPELRQAISKRGMTLHNAITLASIIENEVSKPEDKAQVAQVFSKRLSVGMRLESDATNDIAKENPAYDSYKNDGLPPGPISNVSESSLRAVAFPAQTDWFYFVSGDDGKTHFSKTLREHEELTEKYCTKLCNR